MRPFSQVKQVMEASRLSDGPVKVRADLNMVQLTSGGVEMDVLLVRNEVISPGPYVDRARVQRNVLVGPLLDGRTTRARLDRARERGVAEAMTDYVARQHSIANQAVRLFKVRA